MRRASGRGLVLLPAGAFVVHQLRYSLAYGPQAGTQLSSQGHAYLGSLVPWLVLATAAAFGAKLARIALTPRVRRVPSFVAVWATSALALVTIYAAQETLEGLLAQGHPGGFAGVFGQGGWWSLPVAALVALAIALLVRVGAEIERAFAGSPPAAFAPAPLRTRRPGPQLVAPSPLALLAAGRAPPLPQPAPFDETKGDACSQRGSTELCSHAPLRWWRLRCPRPPARIAASRPSPSITA